MLTHTHTDAHTEPTCSHTHTHRTAASHRLEGLHAHCPFCQGSGSEDLGTGAPGRSREARSHLWHLACVFTTSEPDTCLSF